MTTLALSLFRALGSFPAAADRNGTLTAQAAPEKQPVLVGRRLPDRAERAVIW
jgi:hypothetical protein